MSTSVIFLGPTFNADIAWAIGFTMVNTIFATSIGLFYYGFIRPHYVEKYLERSLEQAFIERSWHGLIVG